MHFSITFTPKGTHTNYLVRTSLMAFLLICLILIGVLLLLLGYLLQLGAIAAPWLIGNGLAIMKGTATLFLAFRLLLLAARVTKRLHRNCKQQKWYNELLLLLRGTLLYLVRRLLFMLWG